MPIELSAEEQTKLTAYLKDQGFESDKPAELLASLRNESKTHREAREKAETELQSLRAEKTERETADKKRADEETARKKAEEDGKKSLEQQLKDIKEEAALGRKEDRLKAEAERKALEEKIAARDGRAAKTALRMALRDAGFRDMDLIGTIDLSKVKVEDGEPDADAIVDIVAEHKKAKPYLYKGGKDDDGDSDADRRRRDENGRYTRPNPDRNTDTKSKIDWTNLKDEEFERQEANLRSARV